MLKSFHSFFFFLHISAILGPYSARFLQDLLQVKYWLPAGFSKKGRELTGCVFVDQWGVIVSLHACAQLGESDAV